MQRMQIKECSQHLPHTEERPGRYHGERSSLLSLSTEDNRLPFANDRHPNGKQPELDLSEQDPHLLCGRAARRGRD
ncbi:hypothetical protein CesoFtcFv8_011793 [Champsocephalus esox]|nr:hypothetical protein CesoFtcFv8_011793 [Champsocephalus esox]